MKPVNFKFANWEWAKDQPEYETLPSFYNQESVKKESISCWKFTFFERLKVLFTGKIYICQLTFGNQLQPILPATDFEEIYEESTE